MPAPEPIRERRAMLAGMKPVLREGTFCFCTTTDATRLDALVPYALALFREDEGTTLVLREAEAKRFGFAVGLPLSRIVLGVFSSLDGVGLTAGVATALAGEGIACNVVAAFHHDHVFVPRDRAQDALRILQAVQRSASSGG